MCMKSMPLSSYTSLSRFTILLSSSPQIVVASGKIYLKELFTAPGSWFNWGVNHCYWAADPNACETNFTPDELSYLKTCELFALMRIPLGFGYHTVYVAFSSGHLACRKYNFELLSFLPSYVKESFAITNVLKDKVGGISANEPSGGVTGLL